MGQEQEMGKRESSKSEWDTGVSVPGALKLDHLQPVEQILFQNFSTFLIFILGLPFLITPERGSSWGWKLEKGIHPKVNETQQIK